MKYFTIKELVRSGVANKYNIDNDPTDDIGVKLPEISKNLTDLINNLLDPIRHKWGKPIYVTNGYRSPELISKMKQVGYMVSATTAHAYGCAADITTKDRSTNKQLFNMIAGMKNLAFDQLINENNYSWIHLGIKKIREDGTFMQRKQILHLS